MGKKYDEKSRKIYIETLNCSDSLNNYLYENYHFRNEIKSAFKSTKDHNNNCVHNIYCAPEKCIIKGAERKVELNCKAPYTTNTYVNGKQRSLVFPNPCIYNAFSNLISLDNNLKNIRDISLNEKNLMILDFGKSDFADKSSRKFRNWTISQMQFKFEYLYKFDISKFYNSIYTHNFENINKNKYNYVDKGIRELKCSKTNGIIMGPVTSTICANIIMDFLTDEIEKKLRGQCSFEIYYFSDQIYIFSNKLIDNINDVVGKSLCDDLEYYYSINHNESGLVKLGDIITEKARIKKNDEKYIVLDNISNKKQYDFYTCFLNISNGIALGELQNYREVKYYIGKIFAQTSEKLRFKEKINTSDEYSELMRKNLIYIVTHMPDLIYFLIEIGITCAFEEYYKKKNYEEKNEIAEFCLRKFDANLFGKKTDEIKAIYYYTILTNICSYDNNKILKYISDNSIKKLNVKDHGFIIAVINVNYEQVDTFIPPFICNGKTLIYSNNELKKKFKQKRREKIYKNIIEQDKNKTNSEKLEQIMCNTDLDDVDILKEYEGMF